MLHRTTSTSAWWPGRWVAWQRGWRAGLNSNLARYLLMLVMICALGCVYLWQANDLSQLYYDIAKLERTADKLEEENIRIVLQSAYWNAPGYIDRRLREEGFVDAQPVVHTRLSAAAAAAAPGHTTQQLAQSPGSP